MTPLQGRRRFLGAALCGGVLAACGSSDDANTDPVPAPVPDKQINDAIAQLDTLSARRMASTGVPGMAVAVVRGSQTVYAKGFGVRSLNAPAPVDADTVFQLASVSKGVGATVVATQVEKGNVSWDTPVRAHLPWFTLSDPAVSEAVTVADLYSHRSGLPDHAGDLLEDMGYDQRQVLERLRYLKLEPFRKTYLYTNFGLTAAAESVAVASGVDWATLSETAIYRPLGMTSTSSRYADFVARPNRAVGHVKLDGKWLVGPGTMPDAQSPAGGVSSSVNDMAKWLAMILGNGAVAGRRIVDEKALMPALSRQNLSSPAHDGRPDGYYGFGFNVGTTEAGRVSYNHSGAFGVGAATVFTIVPSTGVAIVVLTNGYPFGVPETLAAQFFDLVQFGAIRQDWATIFANAFAPSLAPEGSLVGVPRPVNPQPPQPLANYAGTYRNEYYGPLQVTLAGTALVLVIGATPLRLPLTHWDGDVFTFVLHDENAQPGTISKASFTADRVTLEYYDHDQLGTFVR
ncbi:CubicO group peptidase (beta-lactamase class C family) [Paraburkholderia sp. BL8N3]|nr:serine hydrolase [Paraburkholderia sp. BL8N3]TCK38945.1 CubicO group peptidase (beta-lactamase class C family) [Paraburkholderia sp. BL8N3]